MPDNLLLSALNAFQDVRLRDELQLVHLERNHPLVEPGVPIQFVYFPIDCLASWVAESEDGDAVEVGTTGHEGVTGLPLFFGSGTSGTKSFIQIAGSAYRMESSDFVRHLDDSGFRRVIGGYANSFYSSLGQAMLCLAFHTVESRLARWLLLVRQQIGSDEIRLTQEFLAMMLGAQRPTVTLAAGTLRSAGLVTYRYGTVQILDVETLEDAACSCYSRIKSLMFA